MNNLEVIDITKKLNFPVRALINPQFNQTYAIAMVDFGAVDTFNKVPAGAAHFLEHKLFAKPQFDSSQRFAQYGAESNAFTSYTKTAYLFKSIGHVQENIATLLDLISRPFFTLENVHREQEIIAQEINMYADMPDWFLEQTTLKSLFNQDPIAQDIAGSIESISKITPELLTDIYQEYYVPANLRLYLAGKVDATLLEQYLDNLITTNNDLQTLIQRHQKPKVRLAPELAPIRPQQVIHFKTHRAHLMVGIRITTSPKNLSAMILLQNQLDLLLELVFGEMSEFHQKLTNDGLIDDSFGYNVIVERGYAFALISCETDDPTRLVQVLEDYLLAGKYQSELSSANMAVIQRDSIGSYIFAQDYLDNLATEAAELDFYGVKINQVPHLLDNLQVEELRTLAQSVFKGTNLTKTIMYPE
ncbi:EF-P 5-aminopentanol modification-associated protein YfmH [Bombilactobacillus bombi]|uniref:EF-P 5-aminopentanol modification-associated protein YfmH n=1 Tax=Bombilactobacillus bombi TaxID=1303590 RepID=UPI0015E5D894|nr:pitrilysin family protein [Bombilactobacillus bombi]MBA1435160.1 insulinase family protein [Bombilactobacillus bombi]